MGKFHVNKPSIDCHTQGYNSFATRIQEPKDLEEAVNEIARFNAY